MMGDADAQARLAEEFLSRSRCLACLFKTSYKGLGMRLDCGHNDSDRARFKDNKREAEVWYCKAADQGHADAQFNLGNLFSDLWSVRCDNAEAARWYRLAAEQGHAEAQFRLGQMFGPGGPRVIRDDAQAAHWYRIAAEGGHKGAQCQLGYSRDITAEAKSYRNAIPSENGGAELALGRCYWSGRGVPQDFAEAVKWWRRAAELHDIEEEPHSPHHRNAVQSDAECCLGDAYLDGKGVPQDYAQAMAFFRKAADSGYDIAQFKLGEMYRLGQGVAPDYSEAGRWYEWAAKSIEGSLADISRCNLGLLYAGAGVMQDDVEAYKWFNLMDFRLPQGYDELHKKYVNAREQMAERMTSEQIAEAQHRAEDWALGLEDEWIVFSWTTE
jgi:TPR repeat protein